MFPLQALPIAERLANALVAYVSYLGKMFWPRGPGRVLPPSGMPLSPLADAGGRPGAGRDLPLGYSGRPGGIPICW